jgi:hypothetical protein
MFSKKKTQQRDPATWEHIKEINEVYKELIHFVPTVDMQMLSSPLGNCNFKNGLRKIKKNLTNSEKEPMK